MARQRFVTSYGTVLSKAANERLIKLRKLLCCVVLRGANAHYITLNGESSASVPRVAYYDIVELC